MAKLVYSVIASLDGHMADEDGKPKSFLQISAAARRCAILVRVCK